MRIENGLKLVAPDTVAVIISEIWTGTWLVLNLESSPFHRLIQACLTFITEQYAIQLKWVMSIIASYNKVKYLSYSAQM